MVREYRNDQLIVYWDSEKCDHAAYCFTCLPDVFRPAKRPWVSLHATESPEEIIKTIDKCPSGALSYALPEGSTIDRALGNGPGSLASRMSSSEK